MLPETQFWPQEHKNHRHEPVILLIIQIILKYFKFQALPIFISDEFLQRNLASFS